jgi:hypothetical protein
VFHHINREIASFSFAFELLKGDAFDGKQLFALGITHKK